MVFFLLFRSAPRPRCAHSPIPASNGTSQRVTQLYGGEFAITAADGDAYKAAGLSYDTKFNLGRSLELPFNDEYFSVPPGAPNGQRPKLGVLHPALMKRAAAAWSAAR